MGRFHYSARACLKNGERLLADSENLFDWERYPSAFALAKLAQEEFAKCFILKLVAIGTLRWTRVVRRSLNHHISKQLMALILDYLYPDTDELMAMIKNKSWGMPKKVADAMNIYIHEILMRWESKNWEWSDPPQYDGEAKLVFSGKQDRTKQDALYVDIASDGSVIKSSSKFSKKIIEIEIEKTRRYKYAAAMHSSELSRRDVSSIFRQISQGLRD